MNEHVDPRELPELSNEDVELLYSICKRASESLAPPFKALFAAYDDEHAEQQIQSHHDGVVFRFLMRVGESTRDANREGRAVNLVERLRSILQAQGITIVAPSDDGNEEATEAVKTWDSPKKRSIASSKRRVSFDDARLEETWLSERSAAGDARPAPPLSGFLNRSPKRGPIASPVRRTRSASSQRDLAIRSALPKHVEQLTTEIASHHDAFSHPTLLFEPSQTQLELNAEAFLSTSTIRSARQALHLWYDATLRIRHARTRAYSTAVTHDRGTLLKQALDQWRSALDTRRADRGRLVQLKRLEERAVRYRDLYLLTKAFTHWATSSSIERIRTTVAQRHLLKVTYFRKWRTIAIANQIKARKILVTKYLAIWREQTAKRLLWEEQAAAHYEETLLRRCKRNWFWHFCSHRVEGWREEKVERKALIRLKDSLRARRQHEEQAEHFQTSKLAGKSLRILQEKFQAWRDADATAEQHLNRNGISRVLRNLQIGARLRPLARDVAMRTNLNLGRKVLNVWQLHFSLYRQAAEVDRKRVLQTTWTNWNDALRCKVLSQKIDERVLVEHLYRWILQERLKLFRRVIDSKLLSQVLRWWLSKVLHDRDRLAEAQVVFVERQRRSRLAFGMLRLNSAMRQREDAERAALELLNSRAVPRTLNVLRERSEDVRKLAKTAEEARFYFLCTSTLRVWRTKTEEHRQHRRRDAYARMRAKVKIRLVSSCLARWRSKAGEVRSMYEEAEQRAQQRNAEVEAKALHIWWEKAVHLVALNQQASSVDHRKLLGSAIAAVSNRHLDLAGLDQKALDFRQETDQALMSDALKRVQWATFTAMRKVESAEALWMRNRQQHLKQMLRHWAGQVAARRNAATVEGDMSLFEEPESPSIRPGSRTAAQSADLASPSSPPAVHSTPAYLRTPSRHRRAGRFRALPTPAQFTPMAFDSAYLGTTPAPLLDAGDLGDDQALLGLTPQVTPFERKLRAGGFTFAPPSALKSSVRPKPSNTAGETSKNVRFAGSSRFRRSGDDSHEKDS